MMRALSPKETYSSSPLPIGKYKRQVRPKGGLGFCRDLYESPSVVLSSPSLHHSFVAVLPCRISIRKTADFLLDPLIARTRAVTIGTVVCTMIVRLPDRDRLAVNALPT